MARRYASTPRAAIDLGNGIEHAPGCSDAARAIAMLIALTGHLERPGGNLWPPRFSMPALKNRVDFRELVKDLAGCFRVRIELKQIGVRDEAKMLGGVGNCGRPLCCYQWLSDF